MTPRLLGLLVGLAVVMLDQATKYWFVHVFDLGSRDPIRLLPVLDLVLAWNKGVSYSLFRAESAAGRLILVAVALAALLAIGFWLARTGQKSTAVALGLLFGGAAGNLLDRIQYGAVADFLHFHTPFSLGPLSNYVFNIADVAITIGVATLLLESLFLHRRERSGAPRL